MSLTAIVPIKALSAAKGRLAGSLEPADLQAFVAWMAARVLRACAECELVTATLVVAGDEAAAEIGRAAGAEVLVVPTPGLDAAFAAADAATADRGATLIVAADLPEVRAADLEAVIHAGAGTPAVVIAPTLDGGTGALLRRPPTVMRTAYGPGSAAAHADLAAAAGLAAVFVHRQALAHDIDRPDQLPAALALASESDVGCRPR